MDCEEIVSQLNIAYKLYAEVLWETILITRRPYQVYKAKQAYLKLLIDAKSKFEFLKLDSIENLEYLFGEQPAVRDIIDKKISAAKAGDYERAAQLRDQEKKYIERLLRQHRLNEDDHFFSFDGKIYFKSWKNYVFDF